MKIDRVAHSRDIHQRNLEGVADSPVQDRPGNHSVEGPLSLPHSQRDLSHHLTNDDGPPPHPGIPGAETCCRNSYRVKLRVLNLRRGPARVDRIGLHRRRPGDVHAQGHAHLPVPDDRAPAIEIAGQALRTPGSPFTSTTDPTANGTVSAVRRSPVGVHRELLSSTTSKATSVPTAQQEPASADQVAAEDGDGPRTTTALPRRQDQSRTRPARRTPRTGVRSTPRPASGRSRPASDPVLAARPSRPQAPPGSGASSATRSPTARPRSDPPGPAG